MVCVCDVDFRCRDLESDVEGYPGESDSSNAESLEGCGGSFLCESVSSGDTGSDLSSMTSGLIDFLTLVSRSFSL